MRGLFCNKLFKKTNDPTFGWFHLCSDFAQFLTGPSSEHRPLTKMADPPMKSTRDVLSFGLNMLKIKFSDIKFEFFFLQAVVLTDFLQWIPCVMGHPVDSENITLKIGCGSFLYQLFSKRDFYFTKCGKNWQKLTRNGIFRFFWKSLILIFMNLKNYKMCLKLATIDQFSIFFRLFSSFSGRGTH
jgi:hypothetical protein